MCVPGIRSWRTKYQGSFGEVKPSPFDDPVCCAWPFRHKAGRHREPALVTGDRPTRNLEESLRHDLFCPACVALGNTVVLYTHLHSQVPTCRVVAAALQRHERGCKYAFSFRVPRPRQPLRSLPLPQCPEAASRDGAWLSQWGPVHTGTDSHFSALGLHLGRQAWNAVLSKSRGLPGGLLFLTHRGIRVARPGGRL